MISTSKGLDADGNKVGEGFFVFRISDINKKRLEMMNNAKKRGKVPTLPSDVIQYMSRFGGKSKRKLKTQKRKRKSKTLKNKYKRSKNRNKNIV